MTLRNGLVMVALVLAMLSLFITGPFSLLALAVILLALADFS